MSSHDFRLYHGAFLLLALSMMGCPTPTAEDDDDSSADDDDSAADDDDVFDYVQVSGWVNAGPGVPAPTDVGAYKGRVWALAPNTLSPDGLPTEPSLQAGQAMLANGDYPAIYAIGLAPGSYTLFVLFDADQDGAFCSSGDYYGSVALELGGSAETLVGPDIEMNTQVGTGTCF